MPGKSPQAGAPASRAAAAYRDRFAADPDVLASAPGRINLIGEHTDYNGGFVLPCAIDRCVVAAVGRGEGGVVSIDFADVQPLTTHPPSAPSDRAGMRIWADYPRGVVWALIDAGYTIGSVQAAFAGDVPVGAGLSSSAAIEAATALALSTLFQLDISRRELALLCQRAENVYVGVNSGIMDQYASLLCEAGAALLIDCRSLVAESVPFDLQRHDLELLVCNTQTERNLAATGYNERRTVCERAAKHLGVAQLRDATPADLVRLQGEELKRARHVVTENARTLTAADALRREDFATFGRLMYASHASLRDDYEVSTPELDAFVETARNAGALGARLTGAGFGGCAIALIARADAVALERATDALFSARGFTQPVFYRFTPAAGASIEGSPSAP